MMMFNYFTLDEFKCRHTGKNNISIDFVRKLDQLREDCGFPFVITSGYRHASHPIEAAKKQPGMHTKGIAADIQCYGSEQKYTLVSKAIEAGFTGIGVSKTFVHLDTRDNPTMWSY